MRILLLVLVCFVSFRSVSAAEPIHVLVWDERQPRQSEAYENFLGNEIVVRLKAAADDLAFRSVSLDDTEQGLSVDNLEWADVIVWWGHARQRDVTDDNARRILDQVLSGEADLIALHSAHWAKPFVEAMNWRSVEDGRKHLESHADGRKLTIETVAPPRLTLPLPLALALALEVLLLPRLQLQLVRWFDGQR